MSCGSKNLDGLSMFTESGSGGGVEDNPTFNGNVIITGDLDVQGGDLQLGVGVDGWSNIRSHTSAFGLDIYAPLTKKIRLINDIKSIAEIDAKFKLVGNTGNVSLVPAPLSTTYDFIFPTDLGSNGLVLTSQGAGQPLYWTAGGGGGGGGTVTSVDMSVPPFLSITGNPITTAGTLTLTLSGTPLPVLNGGTGTTTSTGTGSVVLDLSPSLTTPNIGVATGLILNLEGTTSGIVSIRVQPVAGTFNFNLPTTAGSANQVLTSQGGGVNAMTWTTPTTGTVTSVNMTVPTFLNVSGGPITNSGTFTVTLSGTPLPVLNGGTGTTTSTGTGSVVLSISPTLTGTTITATITASGDISTSSTTASTTTTTGAIRSAGGLGVVGNANIGGTLSSPNITGSGPITTTGQLSTTSTTNSTSPTTGALLSAGGLGVSGDTYLKQSVNVNFGGTAVAPQLKISPVTTGGISSLAFYRDVNNGSTAWVIGHGVGASGDTNFAISSTLSGLNKLIITPSGPVQFPGGTTSTTFINLTGSTSGTISIRSQAVAGTYNFNLPIDAGTSGYVLTSAGGVGAPMTWTPLPTPGTGTVTSVAATVPTFLSVAGSPITTSGTLTISYSGTPLPVLNGGTGTTTSTGTGSTVLSTSPTLVNPLTNTLGLQGGPNTISILPNALTTSYNFNLPTTAGTTGQVLTSQGGAGAAMTWSNVGSGTVTSVALAVPAFLNIVSGSPIVSSGTITVGLSGTPLLIANGGTSSTTATGTGSVVLQASPTVTGTLTTGRIVASSASTYDFTNTGTTGFIAHFLMPALAVGSDAVLSFGRALTGQESLLMTFNKRSTGQGNYAALQLFASNDALRIYSNNIAATSTTTGTITIQGGLGLTSSIFSGGGITTVGSINANFGGSTTFAQIKISPNVTGGAATIAFYRDVNNGSFRWEVGHGAGDHNFTIFSSESGQNKITITPTGPVDLPTGGSVSAVTVSSSTTTGAFVVTGGVGIGGALNVGGNVSTPNVRIRGAAFQQTISPLVTNGQTTLKFYNDVNETGASWGLGVGANGAGADIFTLESSTAVGNLLTISPTTGFAFVRPLTVTTNTAGSATILTNSYVNTNNTVGPFINGQLFPNVPTNSNMYIANGTATTATNCALNGFHPRPGGNYGSLSIYGGSEIQYFSNGNVTTPGIVQAGSLSTNGTNTFTYTEGTWTPVMTCNTHTITTVGPQIGTYTKIGNTVTITFEVFYNITAGSNATLFMSIPFNRARSGTCVLTRRSDLTPAGSDPFAKCYICEVDGLFPNNVAAFSRAGEPNPLTYFQYGGIAYSDTGNPCKIMGTLTYLTT